jgi:hypothetical protein
VKLCFTILGGRLLSSLQHRGNGVTAAYINCTTGQWVKIFGRSCVYTPWLLGRSLTNLVLVLNKSRVFRHTNTAVIAEFTVFMHHCVLLQNFPLHLFSSFQSVTALKLYIVPPLSTCVKVQQLFEVYKLSGCKLSDCTFEPLIV